ncbi:hypothetical protein QQ054_34495 [Oscillatoria amoena NRMC-F 0135]|nr:hypothetical protein [Oscillatoria amoena NRMC-F 0135]
MMIQSAVLSLSFCALLAFAQMSLAAQAEVKTHSGPDYTFDYSVEWGMESREGGPVLKGSDGISITVAETPPTEKSPKQFAEDSLKAQAKDGQKFTTTKKEEYKTARSGYAAYRIGFLDDGDESVLHFVKLPDNRILVFPWPKTTDSPRLM